MKLIRYKKNTIESAWAILEGELLFAVTGSLFEHFEKGDLLGTMRDFVLLPPCAPSKVLALGYNYKDLVGFQKEYQEPLIFFKAPTSVAAHDAVIYLPAELQKVWAEVELAFVVKKRASQVPIEKASEYILGYTIANDVTAQNIEGRDHHLARSKGLDGFCPVGLFLETELDTKDLGLETKVNERTTQKSSTKNRILNDAEVLALITKYITLEAGDLVLTGTPAGAMDSSFTTGDQIQLTIERLGSIKNSVFTK